MTETIQQKGGKARWKGISKKQRSKIMKKVRKGAMYRNCWIPLSSKKI